MNKKNLELGLKPSAIRELFEFGKMRKSIVGEDNVYDFSIGNPSVAAPLVVNETLKELINEVEPTVLHGYTSAQGDLNVRRSIASYLNDKYGVSVMGEYIYMTCGAAASLTITFNALLNEGDEVVIFAPYFPEYKVFIENANGKVVTCKPDLKTFEPDFNDLVSKISDKTKIVLIDSPNNPTGSLYSEDTIKKIASILEEKQKEYNHPIYFVSDEPYRELIYDDIKYPFVTGYYKNSIVCYSFSKSLSLPGERIGYVLVNPECDSVNNVFASICGAGRSLGFVCAPALFQYMIPKCLGYTSDLNIYKENRDILYNGLKEIGYEVIYPTGAFYIFVKGLEEDALKFSERAKKYDLLIVPSDSFGYPGYVRLAYCVKTSMIKNSLKAFSALYKEYQGEK